MSCYVMKPESIRRIAYTLADILNACYIRNSASIDTTAAEAADLPRAFARYCKPHRYTHNAEGIAEDLHRLNQFAYNGRYPSSNDCDFLPLLSAPQTYSIRAYPRYDKGYERPEEWHFHLVKLLDCYLYQTAEDTTSADPMRKALEAFRNALASSIVEHCTAYTACKWGE